MSSIEELKQMSEISNRDTIRYRKNRRVSFLIRSITILLILLFFCIIAYLLYEVFPLFYQSPGSPEFNLRQLWERTTYPGYSDSGFYWQPTNTELSVSKYSFIPLIIGSFKAAIYALLLATPFALGSAIYVSRFLHHRLANYIKGAIELLASFPTVVLAFLALVLFAPLFENVLLVLLLICLPLFIMLYFSFLYWISPLFTKWTQEWQRLLSVFSVTLFFIFLLIYNSATVIAWSQQLMEIWIQKYQLHYHRYNTLVVISAMAIAILPVIFTIAEDAFSSVPKALIQSSLALGATSWQTVIRIILPMASSGIVVALIMGLMRALGETMIVLIAVDQTPVTNWSLFEGLRTITSTLMIELNHMPMNTIHYHVLFLSALLLFVLTLVMNTIAELIRYRLKRKYNYW